MTHTLNQTAIIDPVSPTALFSQPAAGSSAGGSIVCLRESFDGTRTLCLTPLRNEQRFGDCVAADPALEQAIAPLVARFAALVFTEHDSMIEPLLQQLRWVAFEHQIDHAVLPLWPETQLAQKLTAVAVDLGLPMNFILTQDEATWPVSGGFYSQNDLGLDLPDIAVVYA